MAKIELQNTFSELKKNLVLVSGGPGLSPLSFNEMAHHLDDFNVFFFYPSGTYPHSEKENLSYDVQLNELLDTIKGVSKPYLIGHSFGGIQVVEAFNKKPESYSGVICLSSPFLKEDFKVLSENWSKSKTEAQKEMDTLLSSNPNNENYKNWYLAYIDRYFHASNLEAAKKMFQSESVSTRSYLDARSESSNKEQLLDELRKFSAEKLFIAGDDDYLFPNNLLANDAEKGGFIFRSVENAGHFVHFDQPQKTALIIKDFIINKEKKK